MGTELLIQIIQIIFISHLGPVRITSFLTIHTTEGSYDELIPLESEVSRVSCLFEAMAA
jgi:hypothetical protein